MSASSQGRGGVVGGWWGFWKSVFFINSHSLSWYMYVGLPTLLRKSIRTIYVVVFLTSMLKFFLKIKSSCRNFSLPLYYFQ